MSKGKVRKQMLEFSIAAFEEEVNSLKELPETESKKLFKQLLDTIEPLIYSAKLTYFGFIDDLALHLEMNPSDDDSKESRTRAVQRAYRELIDYYKNY